MTFGAVRYEELNALQKEIFNFHKIAARLADYGYHSIWLNDDWQGADFLACHIDGRTVLRVQLKARMTLDRKYEGKGLHIAFRLRDRVFVYPHDEVMIRVLDHGCLDPDAKSWKERGQWHWPSLPKWADALLAHHEIKAPLA